MEAKKFLFKSSSILSVAIVASLTTFGGANAQGNQNTTQVKLPTPIIKEYKDDYFGITQKAEEISKQKVVFQVTQESPPVVTPQPTPPAPPPPAPPPQPHYRQVNVVATAYTNNCTGCTGITSTGINIRNTVYHEGYRVIATDPSVIPTHSVVRIQTSSGQSFMAVAEDRGGAIHGGIIDVLVSSYNEAINFGRQHATITIIKEGA
jgi:3D (Asp-Asp-Asp) domain-containing protein